MRGKPLVLKRLENGCIIPTSHKLNADGYFRYRRSGASLASLVGVSFSSACRWIREWKA